MSSKLKRSSIGFAALVAAGGIGVAIVGALFQREVAEEIEDLLALHDGSTQRAIAPADLERLPDPVARWLRWAQVVDEPVPATVRLEQEGEFRTGEGRDWAPFDADQYFTTDPPGFLWRVDLRFAPLVSVVGRDRWAGGDASMKMRLLGAIPVVDAAGSDLAQGAMLRWVGEIIWFPQAALSYRIRWEAVDESSARATITAGGQTATATFVFDAEGRPLRVSAERFNDTKQARLPWAAVNERFGEFHGVRVPVAGSASWAYESGDFEYIRWRVTRLDFDRRDHF